LYLGVSLNHRKGLREMAKAEKIIEELRKRNPRYVITGMTAERQLVVNDLGDKVKLYVSADDFEAAVLKID
jgi:ABC-type uncharacterized transport system substrate-binding protein